MKAVLDTSGKTWVPIVVTITIETENEYNALRNIYAVQEVTSLDAEHRVRDRNVITGLINAMLAAIVKK
jgi:hypothetical protein|tara:strand:+ start:127 stop:333 length:207 start_codon:yes stop_codon:yes gene_type:complete